MAVREATDGDVEALAPLLRGYADFYESSPTDEGLEEMARDVIAAPEDRAFMLVATDDGGDGRGLRPQSVEVVEPARRPGRW